MKNLSRLLFVGSALISLSITTRAQDFAFQVDYTSFKMKEFNNRYTHPDLWSDTYLYDYDAQFHEVSIQFGKYVDGYYKHLNLANGQVGFGVGISEEFIPPGTYASPDYGIVRRNFSVERSQSRHLQAAWVPTYSQRIWRSYGSQFTFSVGLPIGMRYSYYLAEDVVTPDEAYTYQNKAEYCYQVNFGLEPGFRYAWDLPWERKAFVRFSYPLGMNLMMSDQEGSSSYWTPFVPYGRISVGMAF